MPNSRPPTPEGPRLKSTSSLQSQSSYTLQNPSLGSYGSHRSKSNRNSYGGLHYDRTPSVDDGMQSSVDHPIDVTGRVFVEADRSAMAPPSGEVMDSTTIGHSHSNDNHVVVLSDDDDDSEDYVPESLAAYVAAANDQLTATQLDFLNAVPTAVTAENDHWADDSLPLGHSQSSTDAYGGAIPRLVEDHEDRALRGDIMARFHVQQEEMERQKRQLEQQARDMRNIMSQQQQQQQYVMSPELLQTPPPNPVYNLTDSQVRHQALAPFSPPPPHPGRSAFTPSVVDGTSLKGSYSSGSGSSFQSSALIPGPRAPSPVPSHFIPPVSHLASDPPPIVAPQPLVVGRRRSASPSHHGTIAASGSVLSQSTLDVLADDNENNSVEDQQQQQSLAAVSSMPVDHQHHHATLSHSGSVLSQSTLSVLQDTPKAVSSDSDPFASLAAAPAQAMEQLSTASTPLQPQTQQLPSMDHESLSASPAKDSIEQSTPQNKPENDDEDNDDPPKDLMFLSPGAANSGSQRISPALPGAPPSCNVSTATPEISCHRILAFDPLFESPTPVMSNEHSAVVDRILQEEEEEVVIELQQPPPPHEEAMDVTLPPDDKSPPAVVAPLSMATPAVVRRSMQDAYLSPATEASEQDGADAAFAPCEQTKLPEQQNLMDFLSNIESKTESSSSSSSGGSEPSCSLNTNVTASAVGTLGDDTMNMDDEKEGKESPEGPPAGSVVPTPLTSPVAAPAPAVAPTRALSPSHGEAPAPDIEPRVVRQRSTPDTSRSAKASPNMSSNTKDRVAKHAVSSASPVIGRSSKAAKESANHRHASGGSRRSRASDAASNQSLSMATPISEKGTTPSPLSMSSARYANGNRGSTPTYPKSEQSVKSSLSSSSTTSSSRKGSSAQFTATSADRLAKPARTPVSVSRSTPGSLANSSVQTATPPSAPRAKSTPVLRRSSAESKKRLSSGRSHNKKAPSPGSDTPVSAGSRFSQASIDRLSRPASARIISKHSPLGERSSGKLSRSMIHAEKSLEKVQKTPTSPLGRLTRQTESWKSSHPLSQAYPDKATQSVRTEASKQQASARKSPLSLTRAEKSPSNQLAVTPPSNASRHRRTVRANPTPECSPGTPYKMQANVRRSQKRSASKRSPPNPVDRVSQPTESWKAGHTPSPVRRIKTPPKGPVADCSATSKPSPATSTSSKISSTRVRPFTLEEPPSKKQSPSKDTPQTPLDRLTKQTESWKSSHASVPLHAFRASPQKQKMATPPSTKMQRLAVPVQSNPSPSKFTAESAERLSRPTAARSAAINTPKTPPEPTSPERAPYVPPAVAPLQSESHFLAPTHCAMTRRAASPMNSPSPSESDHLPTTSPIRIVALPAASHLLQGTAVSKARKTNPKKQPLRPELLVVKKVRGASDRLMKRTAASQSVAETEGQVKARERVRQRMAKQQEQRKKVAGRKVAGKAPFTAEDGIAKARERLHAKKQLLGNKENRSASGSHSDSSSRQGRPPTSAKRPLTVPQAPSFMTRARSGNDPPLARFRPRPVEKSLAQSSGSFEKHLRDDMSASSNGSGSSRRNLTIPTAPKLATNSRLRPGEAQRPPRQARPVVSLALSSEDFGRHLRDDMSSGSNGSTQRRQLTIPTGPKMEMDTRYGEKHQPPRMKKLEATLAQSTESLQNQLRVSSGTSTTKQRKGLTVPVGPKFSETSRHNVPKSTAEIEEEQMQYFQSHAFKAKQTSKNVNPNPSNRRKTIGSASLSVPRYMLPTDGSSAKVSTSTPQQVKPSQRPSHSAPRRRLHEPKTPGTFKARRLPGTTFQSPPSISPSNSPPTQARDVVLATSTRNGNHAKIAKASRQRTAHLAREREKKLSLREEAYQKRYQEDSRLEKAQRVEQVAKLNPHAIPTRQRTEPQPFHLSTSARHEAAMEQRERRRAQEMAEEDRRRTQFVANPVPATTYEVRPVPPPANPVALVDPFSPNLTTKHRVAARHEYDQYAARERQAAHAQTLADEAQRQAEEDAELYEQRRLPVSEGGLIPTAEPVNSVFWPDCA